jgi:hypothetical protein
MAMKFKMFMPQSRKPGGRFLHYIVRYEIWAAISDDKDSARVWSTPAVDARGKTPRSANGRMRQRAEYLMAVMHVSELAVLAFMAEGLDFEDACKSVIEAHDNRKEYNHGEETQHLQA